MKTVKKKRERDRFKQLFISTHNLDFLRYLRRLPGGMNKKTSQYFIINRDDQISHISLMPKYLKEYVTEFNFLFHQIYKCAHNQIQSNEDYASYYSFGNNARRFLEVFLYYKYPNATENFSAKVTRFFSDDALATNLISRLINEYSHSSKVFERSISPVDVPEMKNIANFILKKINKTDPDQYSALLQSIDAKDTLKIDNEL